MELVQAKNSKLAAIREKATKSLEDVRALQDMAKETREKELVENTAIVSVVTSRGYVGYAISDITGSFDPIINVVSAKDKASPVATLNGVFEGLKSATSTGKKNIVLYVNNFEAYRISGMMKRIMEGNTKEVLTAKENEFISKNARGLHGEPYKKMAVTVFKVLDKLRSNGYNIRIMSHNSIFGWALRGSNAMPLSLKDTSVTFRNGIASCTHQGRNYNFVLASGFKLNGEHKLTEANGTIVVEREIKEDSEQFVAKELLSILNTIIIAKDEEVKAQNVIGTDISLDDPVLMEDESAAA